MDAIMLLVDWTTEQDGLEDFIHIRIQKHKPKKTKAKRKNNTDT